ncbi:MAG TPA: hypothetical protein ENI97_01825 [Gammaproteobacteria bacterium]|nr:hypothetical protein [Gammaproteobacteria bacterium]
MTTYSNVVADPFTAPDCKRLEDLGPGCYVRIQWTERNVWVEITDIDGDEFIGLIHPELSDGMENVPPTEKLTTRLKAGDIDALGCGRFCYCD